MEQIIIFFLLIIILILVIIVQKQKNRFDNETYTYHFVCDKCFSKTDMEAPVSYLRKYGLTLEDLQGVCGKCFNPDMPTNLIYNKLERKQIRK